MNVARRLNVDPELALRARERSFRGAGRAGGASSRRRRGEFRALPLDEQDRYFELAKERFE